MTESWQDTNFSSQEAESINQWEYRCPLCQMKVVSTSLNDLIGDALNHLAEHIRKLEEK